MIVDLGSGVRLLGDWLMDNYQSQGPIDADIFITHTHWDHIMGFPMFSPLFHPATKLRIRGPVSYGNETLESVLGAQLSYPYWPIRLKDLAVHIEYDQIKETTLDMGGGLGVTTKYLNHPVLCLGYRVEYQGKSIVTAYDTEPFHNLFPTDTGDPGFNEDAAREGELAALEENEKLVQFYRNADVLIHDCQYTAAEYEADKRGWGHCTYEYAIATALKAKVKKLILFHHDPRRTDQQLTALEAKYRAQLGAGTGLELIMAREGLTIQA
ncbi:beta-lactamase domain protein [Treponema primitia ZAS-2]|uniref:Beta-lactamase domain protein n=1 Tax=Treponema primitia (strain ATCC BAA-887 / DSM 12427 / ZAS-2) TaxID=545694 RepID=F5YH99_TREPZ|nr:beta-lactamase domain protein [Treponema primitia ZAS-2]